MSLYGWTDRDSQAITLVVNHPCNPVDARCEPVLESSPPFGFVVSSLQCQCSHFLLTRRFSLSASCLNSQSSISSEILVPVRVAPQPFRFSPPVNHPHLI